MKNLKFKKTILATLLILMWLFNGCYEFDFVTQPYTADPNSYFEVQVTFSAGTINEKGSPGYFGILMPDGWATTDSIKYIKNNNISDTGYIYLSDSLIQQMTLIDPPPENYHWWVGEGHVAYGDFNFFLDFVIFTDNQTGTFFIDYVLSDETSLNLERSNDHLIIIGDPVGCFPEGITFTDQAEIDNFQVNHPGCTVMAGDVTISGDNITNLDGLDNITCIGGSLKIVDNTNLTILSGLAQLDSVQGSVYIEDNDSLAEISGLTHLMHIGRDLRIVGDTLLTTISLTSFEDLNEVGRELNISLNPNLASLSGFENLVFIGEDIDIKQNNNLTSLTGLNNVTNIGDDLQISSNNSLINLSGLDNLTSIGGDLQFGYYYLASAGNPALTSLNGLYNLTSIGGNLGIEYNDALANLSGLDNIEAASITDLSIKNNSSLSTCEVQSICDYLAAPNGSIYISGNAPGCSSPEEIEEACSSMSCLPEGITFSTQAEIDNFQTNYPGCTEIEGYVNIQGNDIANLNGLNVLTSIGGALEIYSNGALTSLNGLDNLTCIGGRLYIRYTGALTSLSGLNNLTSIGGNLEIYDNFSLTSLSGLENLTSIGGDLIISAVEPFGGNPELTSLMGLENLTSIGGGLFFWQNDALTSLTGLENLTSIPGNLLILSNDLLTSLTGLNNLTFIGGYLDIGLNYSLTSLSGLYNLTSIGDYLMIYGNDALISLTGLDNIEAASMTNLTIKNNSSLSTCDVQSICDYLAAPNGTIEIHDNAPGCNSPEEVEEACSSLSCLPEGITFSTQAEIYNFQTNYPGCTEIEGNVTIHGSDITNLNGLDVLTYIGGYLKIYNNDVLTSLSGLDNLTSIGGELYIYNNYAMTSLSGLNNLNSIGGSLTFCSNHLTTLTGLNNLTSIGENLFLGYSDWQTLICGNPYLISLTGLENLTTIGGSIQILLNPDLTSLSALNNLTSIGGALEIYSNDALTSLTGLENLTSIGWALHISQNDALTNLSGLNNLTSIGGYLGINYNDALTSLSGLDNLTSIGDIDISDNGVLTSLSGLDNLTSIGGIYIRNNNALTSLSGLDNLTSIGEGLSIEGNTVLTSLSGLDQLTSIGGEVEIQYNDALTSLSGLDKLTSIGWDLKIYGNGALISLSGLDNLNSIGGKLRIGQSNSNYGNHALISLSGLDNIDAASITDLTISYNTLLSTCDVQSICDYLAAPNGTIEIHDNAPGCNSPEEVEEDCNNDCLPDGITYTTQAQIDNFQTNYPGCTEIEGDVTINGTDITNLNGLNVLTSIGGDLEIWGNDALTSLSGLENIETASVTNLAIVYNSSLSYCDVESICDYLVPPNGTVEIHDNANGCNSQAQVIAACEAQGIGDEPAEDNRNWNVSIFPNPGSGIITIEFEMQEVAYITVTIFNLTGQQVVDPLNELKSPGLQEVQFDISGLPPGVFYCRLHAGNRNTTKKIMITD